MKRAAIYIRVSTEEQAEEGYSLAAQERACRMYAEVQGWAVERVYADEGLSAFKDRIEDRPQLRQLLDDVAARRVDAVIVHKLDRFFRRVRLLIEVVERFEQQGVQFVSFSEQMDFSTPVGRMILTNLGGFAEFYSRNLSAEVAKGKREKAQQGGWVGPIPIGYEKSPAGTLQPSADAPAVRQIFELYATRQHSYTSIADELNKQGWQTHDMRTGARGRFGRESVRTILGNPAYLGFVSSGGVRFKGKHAPLVSETLFATVQLIRKERTTFHGSPVQHEQAWLRGILWCEQCGGKLWHQFGNRKANGRYYRCSGISRRVCQTKQARALDLEHEMLTLLEYLVVPQALIPEIIAEAQRLAGDHCPPQAMQDAAKEAYAQQLKQAYNAGILTKSEYERKSREAKRKTDQSPAGVAFDVQHGLQLLADMPRLLGYATASERLALVKSLFDHVWVHDRRIVSLTPRADVGPVLAALVRVLDGVPDGARTHNILSHSQALCH
jgi:site-specific DNA recombinase